MNARPILVRLLPVYFLLAATLLARGDAGEDRMPKLPPLSADEPLYGIFLFGSGPERNVWAVLDKSGPAATAYDVLYLDLNANGDLTEPKERFAGKVQSNAAGTLAVFDIGSFRDPATGLEHTGFTLTWRPERVSYRMNWLGGKPTIGAFGSDPRTYGNFSKSPETAPVFVPGHDRPFQFQHWMSGTLRRGSENDFKVFIGTVGRGDGAFTAVDDRFLPPSDYVVATLIYTDPAGREHRERFDLRQRC